MSELEFKYQPSMAVDPFEIKPINQKALSDYKIEVANELSPYIDKINACGGKAVITVNQDGQTFTYQLQEMRDTNLFAQIIDELYSK